MGSDSLLWLTVAGQPLSVRTTADHGFTARPGRCSVAFDITKASLFDQETEQRL